MQCINGFPATSPKRLNLVVMCERAVTIDDRVEPFIFDGKIASGVPVVRVLSILVFTSGGGGGRFLLEQYDPPTFAGMGVISVSVSVVK